MNNENNTNIEIESSGINAENNTNFGSPNLNNNIESISSAESTGINIENNSSINNSNNQVDALDFVPPLVPDQNITKYEPPAPPKKNKFAIIFSVIGILIVLTLLSGTLYYLFIFNKNGDESLKMAINSMASYVEMIYNKQNEYTNINFSNNTVSVIGNVNVNNPDSSKKYLANFEFDLDYSKEKIVFAGSLFENTNELINLIYNYDNEISYVLMKKAFNKPLIIAEQNLFTTSGKNVVTINDYYLLFNKTKQYIINNLNKDDFDVIFDVSKNNGSYAFQKKIVYSLQNTVFDTLLENVINNIENDEVYMEKLFYILNQKNGYPSGYTMKNVKEYLNELKNSLIRSYNGDININIYTDLFGKKINRIELSQADKKLFYYDNGNFEIYISDKDKISYNNKILTLIQNNKTALTIKVNRFDNQLIDLELISSDNTQVAKIKIDNNINISYEEENQSITLNINKKEKNDYEYKITINDGASPYEIYGEIIISDEGKYTLFDKKDAVEYDSLTYDEKMQIQEALKQLGELLSLKALI